MGLSRRPRRGSCRGSSPASANCFFDWRATAVSAVHPAVHAKGTRPIRPWHTESSLVTFVAMDGIINLNKPAGISSAAAVAKVKRLLPRGTKIGHAGTLDPFATGVLLLLVGKATKACERLMDAPKRYEATVRFGANTPTDDPQSEEVVDEEAQPVSRDKIESVL